jgi:hypothetical protein
VSSAGTVVAGAVTVRGVLAASWGVGGFLALLLAALYKLTQPALAALAMPLAPWHWLVLVVNTLAMAYYEGYRGFQLGYSPRLAARAYWLLRHADATTLALAPLFCMGFVRAPRRRWVSACLLTAMIVVLVVLFRLLPQPWRGVLDAGVLVGLAWGTLATVLACVQELRSPGSGVDPEVR